MDADYSEAERLFHYTSARGLYGILESGCLWATHFRFLNDSKEFFAARRSLEEVAFKRIFQRMVALKVSGRLTIPHDMDLKVTCREDAIQFVDIFYRAMFGDADIDGNDAFVFSAFLSSPNDGRSFTDGKLFHWATYGRDGGYAIELNPHKLTKLLLQENQNYKGLPYVFKPISYGAEGEVPQKLKSEFDAFGNVAVQRSEFAASKGEIGSKSFEDSSTAFVRIICQWKDDYFQDEREARISVIRVNKKNEGFKAHGLRIRHASAISIPYIELFKDGLLGKDCPIERIIIGPHQESARRAVALKMFLNEIGLEQVKVGASNIPYANFPS